MKRVARLVARGDVVGIIIPMKPAGDSLLDGLYDIVEVMGELVICKVGPSYMQSEHPERYTAIDLSELLEFRAETALTFEEYGKCNE